MAPSLAVAAPGGYTGTVFAEVFARAVEDGDLSSLRLLSTKELTKSYKGTVEGSSGKIIWSKVDYAQPETVTAALSGVDVLINCMGPDAIFGSGNALEVLIHAASKASPPVKVYFPSEWGFDYDENIPELANPIFSSKKAHSDNAAKLGLKVVDVAVGSYTEGYLGEFGVHFGKRGNVWSMPGDGNIPFAMTAMKDIASYVLRAAIRSVEDPDSIPRRVRVYSEIKTWNEYADIAERKSGEKIVREYISQDELNAQFKREAEKGNLYFILQAAAGTKAASFTESDSHVELLNPGQKFFKPTTFETVLESS